MPIHRHPGRLTTHVSIWRRNARFWPGSAPAISLMGFGFVIARFALWTREFSAFGQGNGHLGDSWRLDMAGSWHGLCWRRCFRPGGEFATTVISAISSGEWRNPPLHVKTSMILAGSSGLGRVVARRQHPLPLIARHPCSLA